MSVKNFKITCPLHIHQELNQFGERECMFLSPSLSYSTNLLIESSSIMTVPESYALKLQKSQDINIFNLPFPAPVLIENYIYCSEKIYNTVDGKELISILRLLYRQEYE